MSPRGKDFYAETARAIAREERQAEREQRAAQTRRPAPNGRGNGRWPRYQGTNPVPPRARVVEKDAELPLTSIGDLLAEPDEVIAYIIDGLIAKASVNVLAAKPKVGKSTLARHLALAVARGEDFLGRTCRRPCTVWYLAFEGSRQDIRKAFRVLGATEQDPLHLFIGKAPERVIARVRARALKERPDLIIVDTMQRFLRAKSTDDYAEMTLLFDHVIEIAQKSQAALLLLTHNSKVEREGLDAILGSTAIAGSADTAILLTRTARYRTIATVQRTGEDLDDTLLMLDKETGRVHLGGSRALADQDFVRRELVTVLESARTPLRREEWLEQVEGRRKVKWAAFRDLISGVSGNTGNTQVVKTGSGTKLDPFRYAVEAPDSCSRVPPRGGNTNPIPSLFGELPNKTEQHSCSRTCTGKIHVPETPEHESETPESATTAQLETDNGDDDGTF